jgi:hypothetical protein
MLFCLPWIGGCVEPYAPPASGNAPDYLVVDGFINQSGDSASVRLSHTVALSSTDNPAPESGAAVWVEDDSGTTFPLLERSTGMYGAAALSLTTARTYRLHIRTSGGKEYFSRYVALTLSPPVDSMYWTAAGNGININIDTHDPTGKSRYYKWRFVETWEYNSSYYSAFMLENGTVVPRPAEQSINTCWRTESSTTILIGTSDRLSGDVIYRFPLQFIAKESIRISKKYSILVEQQVLSEEAYSYWLSLQKSTETLGSLFDPLPSQANGNIYCVDTPSETVIGYFGGGSVETKRIYILPSDIPKELRHYSPAVCKIDTIGIEDIPTTPSPTLLLSTVLAPNGAIIGYTTSSSTCVDCRVWGGGVTVRPDFWE